MCRFTNSTWWMKLLAFILLVVCAFQFLHYKYQHNALEVKPRSLVDHTAHYNWHCELNKKMLKQLQKELNEKNKLLNYRGRVIMKLREHVGYLNRTKHGLTETLRNLTKTISVLNSEIPTLSSSSSSRNENIPSPPETPRSDRGVYTINHLSSFEELKQTAARASRPCCIALNRMTDILREYMESNQELREQMDGLRHVNFTQTTAYDYATLTKVHENFTKRPEKYAVYQTFANGFFYESIPLNRLEPKQKLKSKTFRRNYDFRYATQVAIATISRHLRIQPSLMELSESIFRYDELKGAIYRFVFSYNNTRKITSDIVKPFARYFSSNIQVSDAHPKQYELINVIVPISKRSDRLTTFLENIRNLTMNYNENIFLTIVIYGGDHNNEIKNIIKQFSKANNFRKYDILKRNLPFNRGQALHDGVMRWNGYKNVLLFLCDIDIKISPQFFSRCRNHAKLGESVYMPIVFSLYNPGIVFRNDPSLAETDALFNISEHTGTWRPYGYGMVCMYRPDYMSIGGFNLNIKGWGGEDYSLYIRYDVIYVSGSVHFASIFPQRLSSLKVVRVENYWVFNPAMFICCRYYEFKRQEFNVWSSFDHEIRKYEQFFGDILEL